MESVNPPEIDASGPELVVGYGVTSLVDVRDFDGVRLRRVDLPATAEPALSPDRRVIAITGRIDGEDRVRLVSFAAGRVLGTVSTRPSWGAAWSPDGGWLVYSGGRSSTLYVVPSDLSRPSRSLGVQGVAPTWGG
jgi:WD40-like Beta Propeller Repeat